MLAFFFFGFSYLGFQYLRIQVFTAFSLFSLPAIFSHLSKIKQILSAASLDFFKQLTSPHSVRILSIRAAKFMHVLWEKFWYSKTEAYFILRILNCQLLNFFFARKKLSLTKFGSKENCLNYSPDINNGRSTYPIQYCC